MATGTGNLPYAPTYVSPFDVITSQAENETQDNISALASGTGIGDFAITTAKLAGGSVTAAKTNFGGNYSLSEIDTGFKWVDDKTIYKKTINTGALPNATAKNVAHGITNMDFMIGLEGSATNGSGGFVTLPVPQDNGNLAFQVETSVQSANIRIRTTSNLSAYTTSYVTLTYTKT